MTIVHLPESTLNRLLASRLREARLASMLTQDELARCALMSPKQLQAIESGRVSAGFYQVLKLCHVLGLDLQALVAPLEEDLRDRVQGDPPGRAADGGRDASPSAAAAARPVNRP